MTNEKIDVLTKSIHQIAEEFDICCCAGDVIGAAISIGKLIALIPQLKQCAENISMSTQLVKNGEVWSRDDDE